MVVENTKKWCFSTAANTGLGSGSVDMSYLVIYLARITALVDYKFFCTKVFL